VTLRFLKTCYNHGNQKQSNIEKCENMMDINVGSFEENHGRIQAIACNYANH
jgi:hypothetical protein